MKGVDNFSYWIGCGMYRILKDNFCQVVVEGKDSGWSDGDMLSKGG